MKAALLAREEERQRAEAALVERLLAERPRLTESNAEQWPPPYPYARRCLGDRCACKSYVFNYLLADKYPRRFKAKDPFKCRGGRKDSYVCKSPCSGERVHFTLSEPHPDMTFF